MSESRQGDSDLNGDEDALDVVLQVFDANTETTTNLGLDALFGFQLDGNRLAFLVSESAQGGTDLNGDGDASDAVVHVMDLPLAPAFLIANISQQITNLDVNKGIKTSMLSLLGAAALSLENNRDKATAAQINALVRHLAALSGNQLDEEMASLLSEQLEELLTSL